MMMKSGTKFPPIVAKKTPDGGRKGSLEQRERQRLLPPSLLKIDGTDKIIMFSGFPASLPFSVGGKNGNIVISSHTPDVLKSWRIVAINGTRPPNGNITGALARAQTKNRKFAITFRFGDQIRRSESNGFVFEDRVDDVARLQQEKVDSGREEIEATCLNEAPAREAARMKQLAEEASRLAVEETEKDEARLRQLADEEAAVAEEASLLAAQEAKEAARLQHLGELEQTKREVVRLKQLADDEEAEREAARLSEEQAQLDIQLRIQAIEKSVGLPRRTSVDDPTQLLLSAMSQMSRKQTQARPLQTASTADMTGPCDKCDGPHHESACPHFKNKARENHRDATDNYHKNNGPDGGTVGEGGKSVKEGDADKYTNVASGAAKVFPQPGDGSCLFHSLSHALGCVGSLTCARNRRARVAASTAAGLRLEIENYIATHPDETIGGTAIADWILWDSQVSVETYTARMRYGNGWGGAIEIAVCARLMGVVIQVYESMATSFVRISRFEPNEGEQGKECAGIDTPHSGLGIVNIVYGGRCHYDSLKLAV